MNLNKVGVSADAIKASLCRSSLERFVRAFWHTVNPVKLVWNWHMEVVCRELQRVAERVFRGEAKEHDLVINIPPGSSKSTLVSIMFPAWVWTRMPTARFICVSYAYQLALDLSRKCRDVLRSELYARMYPQIRMRHDQDAKGYFVNTLGGDRYCAGSGGSVTGLHAHFILIDDPLDPNEATSDLELDRTNYWITNTLPSRKVDQNVSVTVLVMQRLHQDDPTNVFMNRGNVRQIKLPATVDWDVSPPELASRYVGGLLDTERLPRQVLEQVAKDVGDYGFAGQYGQDPVPLGGGMFRTSELKYENSAPEMRRVIRFWDKAGTTSTRGAYTVGLKLGLAKDGSLWVTDVVRVRLDSFRREKLIREIARLDGKRCEVGIEEEPGSGGKESAENTVRRLIGYTVRVVRPHGTKESRAEPVSVQVNKGNLFLVKAGWNKEFVQEMRFFPYSKFKDQIDALSGAFTIVSGGRRRVGGIKPSKSFRSG